MAESGIVSYIPNDIILEIFEHLRHQHFLASVSLTCRRFRAIALPLLYNSTVLDFSILRRDMTYRKMGYLSQEDNARAKLIRHLSVKWVSARQGQNTVLLLRLLPFVRRLKTVRFISWPSIPVRIVNTLRTLFPKVQFNLSFSGPPPRGGSGGGRHNMDNIIEILSLCENLTQLSMKLENSVSLDYCYLPRMPYLTHLHLKNFRTSPWPVDLHPAMKSWVGEGDWSALTHLTLESTYTNAYENAFRILLESFTGCTPVLREFFCAVPRSIRNALGDLINQSPTIKTFGLRDISPRLVINEDVIQSSKISSFRSFNLYPCLVPRPLGAPETEFVSQTLRYHFPDSYVNGHWIRPTIAFDDTEAAVLAESLRAEDVAWLSILPPTITHLAFRGTGNYMDVEWHVVLFQRFREVLAGRLEKLDICYPEVEGEQLWDEESCIITRAQDAVRTLEIDFEELSVMDEITEEDLTVLDGVRIGLKKCRRDWRGELS